MKVRLPDSNSLKDFKVQLDSHPELHDYLYPRAFLFSSNSLSSHFGKFPFYDNWKEFHVGDYFLCVHNKQNVYFVTEQGRTFFLFGHAYNPFTMEYNETDILTKIARLYATDNFQNSIDELTGIFCLGWYDNKQISFLTDPAGMQSSYFGVIDGNLYITSHPQLLGDLFDLQMQSIVRELVTYKWYSRVMGCYLPGDLSPFSEVTRIVPNIKYVFDGKDVKNVRFYPSSEIDEVTNSEDYNDIIKNASTILKNGASLVCKKWTKPGVSLTGGIDSNTTFASFNGAYDNIETFSYLSAAKEVPDVEAAKIISQNFKVPFRIINIPQRNDAIDNFELKKRIIDHNNGYIISHYDNEYRKRFMLYEQLPFDVEVKSWVSETIRAYWYKHYGRSRMPRLSPKLFRNLYKIFIGNRQLAKKVDDIFRDYIGKYKYYDISQTYLPADLHYNEVTWGSWGGMNISEMKLYSDITIIYNNRIFLDLLLRVPLRKRIDDIHHIDMKQILNKELADMNIRVVNAKETRMRAFLLNIIFSVNMVLPF